MSIPTSSSYSTQPGDDSGEVYRSTTILGEGWLSGAQVVNRVKSAFHWTLPYVELEGVPMNGVQGRISTMPASNVPEQTALLGCLPTENLEELELGGIQLQSPPCRSLSLRFDIPGAVVEKVQTAHGTLVVAVQGDRGKPAILTYHDLGLNYVSNFQSFFNYVDMRILLNYFCVYHITAPGQEEGAPTLPENYVFPTMDELADQLLDVLSHYSLKHVVGFGAGAGANILARFALKNPLRMEALCLINCVSTQAGWIEWGYQKMNARHLRIKGMTQNVLDYLMWHHFGKLTHERNHDLAQVYSQYWEHQVNPTNLALLIDAYIQRTDLQIVRELDPTKKKDSHTLRMPVMNITGGLSPHVDDTVTLNGRLDPQNSTWMKVQDCAMVLEEQPGKISEAFRLFLQGTGYALKLWRGNSLQEGNY